MIKINLLKLPSTLIHDEHDHHCGCVKCYFTNIISIAKTESIWIIEYISSFTIFNSESSKLNIDYFWVASSPRSPPLHKLNTNLN